MPFTRIDTCKYISAQTVELEKLAITAGLVDLSRLLSIAHLEADNQVFANMKSKRAVRAA